jgi:hypothetical protein
MSCAKKKPEVGAFGFYKNILSDNH